MQLRNRYFFYGYQVVLILLSALALGIIFGSFGLAAWRLLPTWTLALAVVYLPIILVLNLIKRPKEPRFYSAMFLGMIILGSLISSISAIILPRIGVERVGLESFTGALVYGTLPVLYLANWAIFASKGHWRAIDPLFWMALPACYVATMLFTAEVFPNVDLRYPLDLFEYGNDKIFALLWALILYGTYIFAAGYLLFSIDAFLGDRIAKVILLPRIKTVEVEEPVRPAKLTKPAKSVKLAKSAKPAKSVELAKSAKPAGASKRPATKRPAAPTNNKHKTPSKAKSARKR